MTTVATSLPKDINLEIFSLICLGIFIDKKENNIKLEKQLRTSINYLTIFEDIDQCEQHIQSVSKHDRIILIVNDQLGREIISRIHHLRQVFNIYVHCIDNQQNQEWIQQYSKVSNNTNELIHVVVFEIKGMNKNLDDLIVQLQSNQKRRNHNRFDETLSMSILNVNIDEERSTTELDGYFLHSQRLIDCFLRMKSTSMDKNEFISLCYQQYQGNEIDLDILREFEQSYLSDFALWWYTRESFIYKMLNKALRIQNIDIIFLLRFFIRDIQHQLELNQYSSSIRVYRGQLMSNEELKILENSIGELISINSFLSTSLDRNLALFYLGTVESISDDIRQVLFEIDLDPQLSGIRPFANIASQSYFADEQEILIMLGSIFRLVNIHYEKDQVWIVRMELCTDHDHDFKSIFNHMKNEYGSGETNLNTISNVLRDMGQYDQAEKYLHRLLNQISNDPESVSECFSTLGKIAKDKGDYDLSLQYHYKSLEIRLQTLESDDPRVASTYNSIANIYRKKEEYNLAHQSYNKVLTMWRQSFGEDHPKIALCYNHIGLVYQRESKYSEALDYHQKALAIRLKHFPADHSHLGLTHTNIANAYRDLENFELALEHSNYSLNIYKKSLPPEHPQIAETLDCIAQIYEKMGYFQLALSYFEKAANIFRHTLPSTHHYLNSSQQHIQRITSKFK